jgi:hypothetical protein
LLPSWEFLSAVNIWLWERKYDHLVKINKTHIAGKRWLSQQHIYKNTSHGWLAHGQKNAWKKFRKEKSNHIKRKIDVPLEQGMDKDDGDGNEDEEAGQVSWAADDIKQVRPPSAI